MKTPTTGLLLESWQNFVDQEPEGKPKTLYHVTSWAGAKGILGSKSLDPQYGTGEFVSCSEVIKFGGDISGADVAIEMEIPKGMEAVVYTRSWRSSNPEKGVYIAGPDFEKCSDPDFDCPNEVVIQAFLSKLPEMEWISKKSRDVIKIKPIKVWVPDEKSRKRAEKLTKLPVEIPPMISGE